MKLYLHLEAMQLTQVLQLEPTSTVEDAITQFTHSYNRKHGPGHMLSLDGLSVWTEKKKRVPRGSAVCNVFQDRDDVYLISTPHAAPAPSATNGASSLPETQQEQDQLAPAGPAGHTSDGAPTHLMESVTTAATIPPPPATPSAPCPSPSLDLPAVLRASLDKADEAVRVRNLRAALAIYEQALRILPGHPTVLLRLVRLWLDAGRPAEAVPYARAAAAAVAPAGASEALQLLGEALSGAGQGREAVRALDDAEAACERAGEGPARLREVRLALARALHAAYVAERNACCDDDDGGDSPDGEEEVGEGAQVGAAAGPEPSSSAAVAAAAALHERCVGLVMSLVAADEGEGDPDALFLYATLALERGMLQDAVKVSLRLLTVRSSDAGVKALLARCLLLPGGLDALLAELGPPGGGAVGSAAALAFIANSVKDEGAIGAATALFARAVALAPASGSYALNYLHALELEQRYDDVCAEAAAFFGRCGVGLAPPLASLRGAADALAALPPLGHMTSRAWLLAPLPPAAPEAGGAATAAAAPNLLLADSSVSKVQYSPEQLDVLACLFTAVKVAYVGGALGAAARLCALTNPARLASAAELHTTLIRNEAAYFGCVLQLLRDHPPSPPQSDLEPLYLCGDSHCLSGAWREVRLRGQRRLLHPLLVTGCKIWHLRPSSRFYPKLQFASTAAKLPSGAQVMMLFGEIDCREGLLLAVEKCKYDSLEAGIAHTADIYVDLLLGLIRERGWEVFVHPVAPVLNETRPIVTAFMRVLKARVTAAAATPAAAGRLHFLDFFDQMLERQPAAAAPEQPAPTLKQRLCFDGTHLNPAYVELLDAALSAIP